MASAAMVDEEVKTGGAKLSSSHYTISATGSQFTSPFFHPAPAGKQPLEVVDEAERSGGGSKILIEDSTTYKANTHRSEVPST